MPSVRQPSSAKGRTIGRVSSFYISDEQKVGGVECGDGVFVLACGGELDYVASPSLRDGIAKQIDAGARRLLLDLSSVTFIDSTAIGVLVGAVSRLNELGDSSLTVVCPDENDRVLRIFEIAGIDSLIAVHRSREEALSALVSGG
jgi:anti-sigma B factor antagonist